MRRDSQRISTVVLSILLGAVAFAISIDAQSSVDYNLRGSITIVGDSDFTSENGVTGGSGTEEDPYVIEGWEIDGGSPALEISGTEAHYIVRDCYLHSGWSYSIEISNSCNGTFEGNLIEDFDYGGYISTCGNLRFEGNNFSGSDYTSLFFSSCDSCLVLNNSIGPSSFDGITLDSCTGFIISGNDFFEDGISLDGELLEQYSSHEIVDNYVSDKPVIFIRNDSGFSIGPGEIGQVILVNCSDATIQSIYSEKSDTGVQLAFCTDVTVSDCELYAHTDGIMAKYCVRPYFQDNIIRNASRDSISSGPIGIGVGIAAYSCEGVVCERNVITHPDIGIYVIDCWGTTILDNNISIGGYAGGIFLAESNDTVVEFNQVSKKDGALSMWGGSQILVAHNVFEANYNDAIRIDQVAGVTMVDNRIDGNGFGVTVSGTNDISILNNTINGTVCSYNPDFDMPCLAIRDGSSIDIGGNAILGNENGVSLENCIAVDFFNNCMQGQELHGLLVDGSDEIGIWNNSILDNADGMLIEASEVSVAGNDIIGNEYGIWVDASSVLVAYHNNFVLNTIQAWIAGDVQAGTWNSSYPIGGNFWDDYNGKDEYSGPVQDIAGSDGIGDTPYMIDFYNEDAYPLMEPTHDIVMNTAPVAVLSVNPSSGGTLDVFTFDASESHDPESDSSTLEIRWDWEDDSVWDVDWSTDKVEEHRFQVPGSYITRIEVRDQEGLTDQATVDFEVMDDIPPATDITVDGEVGEDDWYVSEVEITLSFADAWSEVTSTEYCLDGGAWVGYADPFWISAQGNHILQFYSDDENGNSETIQEVYIDIDSQAPLLWIHHEQDIVFDSSSPSIAWSCQDAVSGICRVELSVDEAEFEELEDFDAWVSNSDETTTYVNLTDLEEGDHTIVVRVYDFAGLKSEATLNFGVDIETKILGMSPIALVIVVSVLGVATIATLAMVFKRRGSLRKPPE